MREDHYEIQINSSNRKSKQTNSPSNHQHKDEKKSLSSVFISITENDMDPSSVSEAADIDPSSVDIRKTSLTFDHNSVSEESVKDAQESDSSVFEDDQHSMEMAESQKSTASGKPKEKSSLLDKDINKDFLGSRKSLSMEDNRLDFEFGPPTQDKTKASNFKNLDFGKLPSFKMDMLGLNISSPSMKSGNTKERSKRGNFQLSIDVDDGTRIMRAIAPMLSKNVNKPNGSQSELLKASVSSTKLVSTDNKIVIPLSDNSAVQKRGGTNMAIPVGESSGSGETLKLDELSRTLSHIGLTDFRRRGDSAAQLEDWQKARKLMNNWITKDPRNPSHWITAARLEESAGHLKKAQKLIQESRKKCPKDPSLLNEEHRLAQVVVRSISD